MAFAYSMGFDQRVPRHGIIRKSVTDLKIPYALSPSLTPNPWQVLIFLLSLQFCLFQNAI